MVCHGAKTNKREHHDQKPEPQVVKDNVRRHVDHKRRYCQRPWHYGEKTKKTSEPQHARPGRKKSSTRERSFNEHQSADKHYMS